MSLDAALPTRVNLGCGWDKRDGYLNVDFQDFHEPDLVADVRNLAELPSAYFDEVVAQDVLEHLPRADGPVALREWARLLKPGGRLVLRVPDVIGLARLLTLKRSLDEQRELIQNLYGTQAYDGDWHANGYTELILRHELHEAGFADVEMTHRDGWLFDVVATRAGGDVPLDLGPLPFMRLDATAADPGQPGGRGGEDAVLRLIEQASAAGGLPFDQATPTRLAGAKRAALRLARSVMHPQIVHNRAVEDALRELLALQRRRGGSS